MIQNPIRNGRNGVVVGASGDDMFYYCITRMNVSGSITVNGLFYLFYIMFEKIVACIYNKTPIKSNLLITNFIFVDII